MKISDRAIGYITIAIATLICVWVVYMMHLRNAEGSQSATIYFSQLGSLQPQDAVVERGVRVGHVRSTSLYDGYAKVVIDFDLPVKYSKGTRFLNSNYSLMGQRYLVILPQHKGELLDLREPIQGEYEPGIAEAMHLVEHAVQAVDSIKTAIELLARGTSTHPSFATQFNSLMGRLDGTLSSLNNAISQSAPQIESYLRSGSQVASTALRKSEEVQSSIDSLVEGTQFALTTLNGAIHSSGDGIATVAQGLDSLSQTKAWQELFEKRDLHDSLLVLVQGLHHIVDVLQGNAESPFKMSFWKFFKNTNWNILGETAREKRARRLAEER